MSWAKARTADIEIRLAVFGITDEVRTTLAACWPLVEPCVPLGVDDYLESCRPLTWVAEKLIPHRAAIQSFYKDHLAIVLNAHFDERYVQSLARKRQLDEEMDLHDARPHAIFGHFVLRRAAAAISRKYRLSAVAANRRITALSQVLALDNATTLAMIVDGLSRSTDTRKEEIDNAIGKFGLEVDALLKSLADASASLTTASGTMTSVSDLTSAGMAEAFTASTETSRIVNESAAASEQVAASIAEVQRQTLAAADKARTATEGAARMNDFVRSLSQSVSDIGSAAKTIAEIATRTNLLALNATIEAARAGSTGRGFAVVASEVKALSNQTSRATDEISRQIAEVQNAARETIDGIATVSLSITEMSKVASTIAHAIGEQTHATALIGEGMQAASTCTRRATSSVESVERDVKRAREASAKVVEWSELLSDKAGELTQQVKSFFEQVRAA